MKAVIQAVTTEMPFSLEEIDVDSSADLAQRYNAEVPLLFIDGRKAFKYRVTKQALKRRLQGSRWALWRGRMR
jgi:hypothetical protein